MFFINISICGIENTVNRIGKINLKFACVYSRLIFIRLICIQGSLTSSYKLYQHERFYIPPVRTVILDVVPSIVIYGLREPPSLTIPL